MAETKETIVLEINATDALSQIAEMQKEMNALREAQKGFTTDSAEYQAIAGRIRIVTKDQADLKRALDASVKARREELDMVNFGNNSIKQNRELLKQLTAQYVELRNPSALPAATAQIKSLSDALKAQEAAIGDTRRNVGNYKEAMQQALGSLTALPGAAGQAAQGMQAMNAAFAAGTGPIGLILTAITALIPILQNNAEFADELTFAMDGLTKMFEVLVDFAIEGVKQLGFLKNAFSDPIGTIKQLGQMLADNLINRFKALGGFIEAISLAFQGKWADATKAALNASVQLTTGVENLGNKLIDAGVSGSKASRQFDALEQAMGKARNQSELYQKQAEILERSLKNTTLSEKERIKIANEAADNYIKAAKTRQDAAKLELAAQQELLKGQTATDAELKKLDDLKMAVKLAALDAEEAIAQRQTRIDRLLAKEAKAGAKDAADAEKEKTKAAEEEAKKREAAAAAEVKRLSDLSTKAIEDERTVRIFALNQLEDSLNKRLALFDANFEAEEEKLRAAGATELAIADARNKEIADITDKFNKEQQEKAKKAADEQTAIAKKQADDDKAIQEAKFAAATSIVNALTQINQAVLGNSAAGLAFQKALALADIGISTATAIATVVAAATKDALSSPLGIIQLVASVATGIATVTANIMKATQLLSSANTPSAPELQTFEDGGEVVTVGGKRHRDGGTKFVGSDGTRFEAEQGEKIFVMKRTAAANIGRLSAFNQLYGGNAWDNTMTRYAEDGGLVFDGGMTTRSMSQPDLAAQIQQAVANMPAPVVSVKEINTVNTRRTIAQEQAGL